MAKINEVVNRVVMKSTSEGFDETTGKLKAQGKALDDLAKSGQAAAQVSETSAKRQLSMKNAFETIERRLIGVARAQFEYDKVKEKSDKALQQFPELQGRYNAVMAEQTSRLNAAKEAAERNAVAQLKMQQSMRIPEKVPEFHEATAASLRRVREELVPLFGIGQRYKEQVKEIRAAVDSGAIKQNEGTAAIQRARAATHEQVEAFKRVDVATGKYINGTGLARHELINFSRQAQDVAVSLGSGQGFATVLLQQGSQIADIFISSGATMKGFFSQVAAGAAFVLKPIVAIPLALATVGTAAVAAMFNFDSGQKEVQKSLLGIGKASGATRDDINKIAKESASSFGLSVNEAQQFASALAATGRVGVDEIGKIVALGKDVARIYGVDAAEAAEMLAKAYADPAKGAEQLNQRLGSFNAATQETIKNLQIQNNMQAAQSLLTAGVSKGVEGISATVAKSTTIWEAMGNTISNAWRAFGEGAARAVGLVEDSPVKRINNQLRETEIRIEEIRQSMDFRSSAADMPGVSAGPVMDKTALEAAETKLRDLTEQARMLKDNLAQTADEAKRVAESLANQKLVDTFFPLAKQLKEAEAASQALDQRLKDIAASGGGSSKILSDMGRSLQDVQMAARLAAEAVKELQDKMAQQERRVGRREEVREQFKGTGISADVGMQLNQMKDQLAVASAITGQERMRAQELATINQLMDDGKSKEEAMAVAAAQRGIAQAQINSQAQQTLASLKDQLAVSEAVTGQEKMAAQEAATRNSLIREGVDASLAGTIAATERANSEAQVTSQVRLQNRQLSNQLQVSSAVGGAARIEAQHRATIANLTDQGVDASTAMANADLQRANSYAQINAQAQETLAKLQDQHAVSGAVWGIDKIRAEGQATFNDLIRQGVSETNAQAVASQQVANAIAAATAAVIRQTVSLQEQTALVEARRNGTEATVAAEIAYNNAVRSGASDAAARDLARATEANVRARNAKQISVLAIEHWAPNIAAAVAAGDLQYDKGIAARYDPRSIEYITAPYVPTTQALQRGYDEILSNGQSITSGINSLINGAVLGGSDEDSKIRLATVNRLVDLLPDKEQIPQIEKMIAGVRNQPVSLAREELIKELTDKLEGLKNSTDALNDTIELDPLYTQGHGYVGIGYYGEGGRSTRIPIDPNTPPHVPDLSQPPTTTPVLPPPTMPQLTRDPITPIGPNPGWGQPTPGITNSYIWSSKQLSDIDPRTGQRVTRMANGGSFTVGGTGGTDSQYIPMRFTPGEMIDVTPPHGRNGGKPTVVNNITNNFNFPPDRSYGSRRTQRQAREGYGRSMAVMH